MDKCKPCLQELVRRFPGCSADVAHRFFVARRHNLEHAATMLETHMAWRKETLPVSRNEPLVAAEFAKVGRCRLTPG